MQKPISTPFFIEALPASRIVRFYFSDFDLADIFKTEALKFGKFYYDKTLSSDIAKLFELTVPPTFDFESVKSYLESYLQGQITA